MSWCCKAWVLNRHSKKAGIQCAYSPLEPGNIHTEDQCLTQNTQPYHGACVTATQEIVYDHSPGPDLPSCKVSNLQLIRWTRGKGS